MHGKSLRKKPRWRRQLRVATAVHRTGRSDLGLAIFLAFIAGGANAGGFMLLGSYASHMTGNLSQIGDQLALFNFALALKSAAAVVTFVLGAAVSAALINWARLKRSSHRFAIPLGLQGLLFLGFALFGLDPTPAPAATLSALLLLCFIMGMQNATITKISGARIRTTHATGMITDVGIEAGKAVFGYLFNIGSVRADPAKLSILLKILGSFIAGGIICAFGFSVWSYAFALPLGFALLFLATFRA
jgi:uncharacterized membrane protein YoaK (UPF0700 family)